jgi:hypothetical protein
MKLFRCSGLVLGALGLCAGHLAAAPRTINDCEKIQATDAYNQCLASFGPVAHLRPMKPLPGGSNRGGDSGGDEGDEGGGHVHYHYRHGHHGVIIEHRHGRHFMVLSTGGHGHGHHRHRH